MNTKELERNIKTILATGRDSGYGPEFTPILKQARAVLKKINKGRSTAEKFFELGELCLKLEDSVLALNAFKTGYQLNPNHVNCGCYYGLLLEQKGDRSKAISVYLELNKIAPENIVLAERMLIIFYETRDYRQVFLICQFFLTQKYNYAITYEYIAKVFYDYGNMAKAVEYLENALAFEPDNDKYIQRLLLYYYSYKKFTKIVEYQNYIDNTSLVPTSISLLFANSLAEIGRISDARKYFVKLLLDKEANNKFDVLAEIGIFHATFEQNIKKSMFINRYILNRDPINIHALSNMALFMDNDYSLNAYRKVYQQNPDSLQLRINYSYILFDNGQLEEAFLLNESRIKIDMRFLFERINFPQDIQYKTIFIWKEQGLGDQISWSWYYQYLCQSNVKATIQVDERILPLMSRTYPNIIFTDNSNKDLINDWDFSEYDAEIPIASLGKYYINEIFDAQNSFEKGIFNSRTLQTNDKKVSYWKEKINNLTAKTTVGVCWRSMFTSQLRFLHYLTAEQIVDIFADLDCCIVNVQYEYTQQEIDILSNALGDRFIHFPEIDLKNDQDDLAALLEALDFVFTAQTAVYQLAGAIGKKTFTFVYQNNDSYINFGKPYDIRSPTVQFFGEKDKCPKDSIQYLKLNLENFLLENI